MNEINQSVKKYLVAVVVLLTTVIALASVIVLLVNACTFIFVDLGKAPSELTALYSARKPILDLLFVPVDKLLTLLQVVAATAITYIFAKDTVPTAMVMVADLFSGHLQNESATPKK